MHHAKTDSSDATSLPRSSPPRSPSRRGGSDRNRDGSGIVYYVQSPSRDSTSHDGEKTNNSPRSTPENSPMGSPPHSHSNSSLGPTSRESSSTRFSGSAKKKGQGRGRGLRRGGRANNKHPFDSIEEEGLLSGDEEENGGVSRRCCYVIWFVAAFFVLFSFFSLVLWGASRNQKPFISLKSIKFEEFEIQAGVDLTGVATGMATLNATVKLMYRNKGTFFGVHVSSTPLLLSYEQVTLASGMMKYFYEKRRSERQVSVQVKGDKVPLYGASHSLISNDKGAPMSLVPMTLNLRVRSRAYVLGRLVKPKFYRTINCHILMDPKKMNKAFNFKNNCTYT